MKIRIGFVSNSSSSSFAVPVDAISGLQVYMLFHHLETARTLNFDDPSDADRWSVSLEDGVIQGRTSMDNFDMQKFMEFIGIDGTKVEWGDG